MTPPIVGFAGMTHLGLVSASAVASRNFDVICFDRDPDLVTRLQRQDWPVFEPGLDALIRRNGGRQCFSSRIDALNTCNIIYVAPDVPTDDNGGTDVGELTSLIHDVAAAMNRAAVMVVLSQIPPGYTRGLNVLPHSRLYCQVETLVLGEAVERAIKPDRIIVGCSDPETIDAHFRMVLEAFGCPILPMRYESAELAKISINLCLVASLTTANMLAELCEHVGADWSAIAPTLRLDRRIGPHAYLTPGLGISGGNLERDLATVWRLAEAHGSEASLIAACRAISARRKSWPLRILHDRVLRRCKEPLIGVLGLAYKENTQSTRNSPALALIGDLPTCRLQVFDPMVRPSAQWHRHMTHSEDALAASAGADALVIMTPWPQFRALSASDIAHRMRGRTVIDPYQMLDHAAAAAAGLDHVVLGAPPRDHG